MLRRTFVIFALVLTAALAVPSLASALTTTQKIARLEKAVGALQTQVKSLQAQVRAKHAVLNGVGAPAVGLGTLGDFYMDSSSHQIYGPKTIVGWGTPTPLKGARGDAGDSGPIGPQGPRGDKGDPGPAGATDPKWTALAPYVQVVSDAINGMSGPNVVFSGANVFAKNAGNYSLLGNAQPPAPTDVVVTAGHAASEGGASLKMEVTWSPVASSGLVGYRLYHREMVGDAPGTLPVKVADVDNATTSCWDQQVQEFKSYRWGVSAVYANGLESGITWSATTYVEDPHDVWLNQTVSGDTIDFWVGVQSWLYGEYIQPTSGTFRMYATSGWPSGVRFSDPTAIDYPGGFILKPGVVYSLTRDTGTAVSSIEVGAYYQAPLWGMTGIKYFTLHW